MKRSYKKTIAITTLSTGLFLFSGCAEIVEETNQMAITSLEKENVISLDVQQYEEVETSELESKYLAGILTKEEYLQYAVELESESRMYESRSVLEDCYRLFLDEEAFLRLQNLTVNLKEDDTEILDESMMLMDFLQAGNKENDVISEIMSQDLFAALMPKLYEGCRNYYLDENERSLYLTAGYDENHSRYVKLWYVDENAELIHYEYSKNQVKKLYTSLHENDFQGEFRSVVCDGNFGDIFVETGEFRNGLLTGDYRLDYYLGETETDLYSLSCNWEEFELKSFFGKFEEGKTTLKQEENIATDEDTTDCVIYAYDEDEKNYLYASEKIFDFVFLGWSQKPEVQKYEPIVEIEEEHAALAGEAGSGSYSNQPVRIYDGQIQWFDGKRWKNVGSVEEMITQDPFYEYREHVKERQLMEESKGDNSSISETEEEIDSKKEESSEEISGNSIRRVSQLRERIVENKGVASSSQNTDNQNSGNNIGSNGSSGNHNSSNGNSGSHGGSNSNNGNSNHNSSNSGSKPGTGSNSGTGSSSGSGNSGSSGTSTQTPSNPAPSNPTPSDPAPSNPAPSDPAPSNPTPSDPAPSNPTPSDPAPSNPTPSDPAPSNPTPSDPAPSDPAPSDPAPGNNGDTDIGWGDWSDAELEP